MTDIRTLITMIKQLAEILTRRQRIKMLGVLFLIIISAICETIGVSFILVLVQAIINPESLLSVNVIQAMMSFFSINTARGVIWIVGFGMIALYFIKNLLQLWVAYERSKFSTGISRDAGILIMKSYMNHPYEYFTYTNTSEILQGVNGDSIRIQEIISALLQLVTEGLTALLIGVYIFTVDSVMATGMVLLAIFCSLLIVYVLKKKMSSLGIADRNASSERNRIAIQISNGIKEIHVMQKKEEFLKKFEKTEYVHAKTRCNFLFMSAIPERTIEGMFICGFVLVVLIRDMSAANTSSFVASLAAFAMAAFRILPAISRMSGYLNQLIFLRPAFNNAYTSISNARDFVNSREKNLDNVDNSEDFEFNNEIRLDNVSWKYKNSPQYTLCGLSLSIKKGQSIGIIGESGAGKSTLSDILLGLYSPQEGNVSVDGHVITSIPKSWGRMIGYVPQMVFLMDDTLRENIAFGEANTDEDRIWSTLERASLKEYVEALPDGLDTMVGEHGIKLSGGQRQRIAIARALYHDPSILILDEATSALDNETEAAVMDAIESLQGNITLIIIAHRLTTIRNCDIIVRIENGTAIEVDKNELFDNFPNDD